MSSPNPLNEYGELSISLDSAPKPDPPGQSQFSTSEIVKIRNKTVSLCSSFRCSLRVVFCSEKFE